MSEIGYAGFFILWGYKKIKTSGKKPLVFMARLKGLEPLTYWFVASHSIQLSYKRIYSCQSIISQIIYKCKYFFKKI